MKLRGLLGSQQDSLQATLLEMLQVTPQPSVTLLGSQQDSRLARRQPSVTLLGSQQDSLQVTPLVKLQPL